VREPGLAAASRIADATGAKLFCETFPARLERGAGVPAIERLGYLAEFTVAQLAGARHLVLVDARAPVSFFAYPEKPSYLVPEGCEVHELASGADDAVAALAHLADLTGAGDSPTRQPAQRPERPTGDLTAEKVAHTLGALLPEHASVSDEANTSGLWAAPATAGAPRHDWLTLTGGAIGQGLPVATGAAVACPDRKVVSLEAEGSAMYTLQALWTQAREGLDVTTVVFNNRSYAILNLELSRVGAEPPGPKALDMLDLSRPELDFVSLAEGMGIEATRARTADEFTAQFARAIATPGPNLVEALLPTTL
jgi:acetolactate synthase I/II/III large subunit